MTPAQQLPFQSAPLSAVVQGRDTSSLTGREAAPALIAAVLTPLMSP